MNLGLILKELRLLKKASQLEIATKLNIERSTYTKWETGHVMLKVNQLKDVSDLYGISLEHMVRCVDAEKLVFINDIERLMHIQERKEIRESIEC